MASSTINKDNVQAAETIIDSILEIHGKLLQQPSLGPGEATNQLLSRLVRLCCHIRNAKTVQQVLSNTELLSILPSLQSLCGEAECLLESHWAERIVADIDQLDSFPYYDNYKQLARIEFHALCAVGPSPRRLAFLGSGPLPLTSLCLVHHMNRAGNGEESYVLNVDRDASAISVSHDLFENLGLKADFLCADIGSGEVDLTSFDAVYLAALVGASQAEKERLLATVVQRMRPGALLVVRSSWGLRKCLYPELDAAAEAVRRWVDVVLVLHPYGEVVNSIIVARVKAVAVA
ncbi:hypothetical protein CP532_5895 [Ophiocordyceps camponoti-leonardi (nom. inval.)]|nr:hypothetical protein CP532_5895 [Ophiocordyceps camponoti-leonardi (nom. inval.)]